MDRWFLVPTKKETTGEQLGTWYRTTRKSFWCTWHGCARYDIFPSLYKISWFLLQNPRPEKQSCMEL